MRRVVSVWFPHWPTDRLRRQLSRQQVEASALPAGPLVTAWHDGRRRVVAAADQVAAELGLRPGQAMAQAVALVPGLHVMEAEPEADADALQRLARWCHRFTPLVSCAGPDGLWLDISGCAHLFGTEAALLDGLVARLARDRLHARAAVADTPGAAHALARHGKASPIVVPSGEHMAAIGPLPVAALRLAPELDATLRRLGFERVGHLARIPRPLLARRFGPLPGLRLDQAHGRVKEPLVPLATEPVLQRRVTFLEPLLTAEALSIAIAHLMGPLCEEMERQGFGARQLDLLFERIDNQVVAVRVGTARPSRDAAHLARMLDERLDTVDPGLGVEAMRLVVGLAEPLRWEQQSEGGGADVARLVDRLSNRLGADRVYRAAPVESDIPERSVCKIPAFEASPAGSTTTTCSHTAPNHNTSDHNTSDHNTSDHNTSDRPGSLPTPSGVAFVTRLKSDFTHGSDDQRGVTPDRETLPWRPKHTPRPKTSCVAGVPAWPGRLQAPARLFDPPRPVTALAALPDQPPVAFTWRGQRHKVRRADGPERIYGEWWRADEETQAVRDYFLVEDEAGQRFWLFRRGNGIDARTGTLEWFLHGI